MDTFTAAIKAAIEANANVVGPVKIRRSVEIDVKRDTAKTFTTIAPGKEWLHRPENTSSYLVRVSALIRMSAVYATDASAVSALATLVMEVRKALYGHDFGGRMFVSEDITGEYQTDDVTQNHYYFDMELTGEYQESTS
jgi:hypothetical protein